jgi:hypothetical protein
MLQQRLRSVRLLQRKSGMHIKLPNIGFLLRRIGAVDLRSVVVVVVFRLRPPSSSSLFV